MMAEKPDFIEVVKLLFDKHKEKVEKLRTVVGLGVTQEAFDEYERQSLEACQKASQVILQRDIHDTVGNITANEDVMTKRNRKRSLSDKPLQERPPIVTYGYGNSAAMGLNPQTPYVRRERLETAFLNGLSVGRFFMISAPPGTGKSSFITLFSMHCKQFVAVYCNFLDCTEGPFVRFKNITGIPLLDGGTPALNPSSFLLKKRKVGEIGFLVFIDDAQEVYSEVGFWKRLLRQTDWLDGLVGAPVKIVVSATHALSTRDLSPVDLKNLPRLDKEMLFSEDGPVNECMALFHLEPPTGLIRSLLSYTQLMEIVVKQCAGVVGALRISINELNNRFVKEVAHTEEQALQYFMSSLVLGSFERCFPKIADSEDILRHQVLLTDMFLNPQTVPTFNHTEESKQAKESFDKLEYSGLIQTDLGIAQYSSPLAMRVVALSLFPQRAPPKTVPESLYKLIVNAVSSMSASALCNSCHRQASDRPKEAVYHHNILTGLYRYTPPDCGIQSELSRSFSSSERIEGEIDFYVDKFMWGIELLIDGSDRKEHEFRFSRAGKYHKLNSTDYFVVDMCTKDPSQLRSVKGHNHLMTVFFSKDFTTCQVRVADEVREVCLQLQA